MSVENLQLYKCNICGNIVEVVITGGGELVCCGQPMNLLQTNTVEGVGEKHIPVMEINEEHKTVRIGSIPHPMLNEHYIMFIETMNKEGDFITRKYLKPGEEPKMEYLDEHNDLIAREYCNIHGLWSNKNDQ